MRAFLTHSSIDKEFVRFLDASLLHAGVSTFFDERDIMAGESIPGKIYQGIEQSDFLLYVISENSINSQWVEEEVSIAKIRQKAFLGIQIIPILIDKVTLPISVSHIKYADFTRWADQNLFRISFLQLLNAMGVSPTIVDTIELNWYVEKYIEIKNISKCMLSTSNYIMCSVWSHQAVPADTWPFFTIVIKRIAFEEDDFWAVANLNKTIQLIEKFPESKSSAALQNLARLSSETITGIKKFLFDSDRSREDAIKVSSLFLSIWIAIEDIRSKAEMIAFSCVK